MHPDPDALPFVDEHGVEIAASPEAVWESLYRVAEGSSFPGFVVARAEPGSVLALAGRHRYSDYALVFHLTGSGGTTRLRAETRARFPGASGRLYRAAVIGTRAHVLVTMRLLTAVKRRAER